MKTKTYQWILYTIVIVILAMIGIQSYWNYKNYVSAEQELIKDVQVSLDKAVDKYYANLAEKTTMAFSLEGDNQKDIFTEDSPFNKVLKSIDEDDKTFTNIDSIENNPIEGVKFFKGLSADSMMKDYKKKNRPITIYTDSFKHNVQKYKSKNQDFDSDDINLLLSNLTISIQNDTLDLKELDSLFNKDINRKNIDVNYKLNFTKKDEYDSIILKDSIGSLPTTNSEDNLKTFSNSTFLPKNSELNIVLSNPTLNILSRIVCSLLLSLLLVLAVISCLFYLLYVIKNQKELAEVKNDLISNITHEFKTPIATIGVALEGIKNFNDTNDKEKTRKYIDISTTHLNKLNTRVEKLLETATINSENLELKKEYMDLVEMLNKLVNTYQIQFQDKTFNSNINIESLPVSVDVFHFENAINNIIDNAVKYGGDEISVELKIKKYHYEITISDNGSSLKKAHQHKIFEKFYRVPKGNTHDVKGFGIGLHYSKSIIEKHQGNIRLELKEALTTFKISIPNV